MTTPVTPVNDGYFCLETLAVTIDSRGADETAAEIAFCERVAELDGHGEILDVGCGAGRQSIAFARLGYNVLGIDKSDLFLAEARQRASREGLHIEFRQQDARRLSIKGQFDLAVSFYTAFGYHDDTDNQRVVNRISDALRPGGRFVLDVTNRDAVANATREFKVSRSDGLTVVKENTFDPVTSRRRLDWTYIEGDRVKKRVSFDHRLYSLHELISLFNNAGLSIERVFRGIDGTPFIPGARRIILVGRRS